jgi:outer membrane receptor protein involved in Fe transport
MLNFNLTYRPPSQRWTLVAYAHNVTDAREYTGGQESQSAAPLFAANINPPRTYGAQLTYTW